MRVLVTGAYGLIGSACLARLHLAGHDPIGAGRSIDAARRRLAYAQWRSADFRRLVDTAAWLPLLAGIDAVVNCVGVLQDGAGDDVERVQFDATVALFEACVRTGIKRLIHISAIGAVADGPSAFARTKAAAEAHLQRLDFDWVILRPALVLAPAVYGSSALLRGLSAFPGCVPLAAADARIQVIGIDDLAETVARALLPDAPTRVVWDVAHPQVHSLAEIVTAIRAWLGFAPRPLLRLPAALGTIVAVLADALGWLGWRSPLRRTSFAQLSAGVVGDPTAWVAATGFKPQGLDQILAAHPANVQDRWFARLYLIKPLAIAGLAVATLAGGILSIVASTLRGHAFGPLGPEAMPGFLWGAVAVALSLGLIVRATVRLALIALLVFVIAHASLGLLNGWEYGLTLLAAASMEIPPVLAMLFLLAILDER